MTTADLAKLRLQLVAHEGLKRRVYRCSAGKLTIGVGRNLEDRDLSMSVITRMLDEDVTECLSDLRASFSWFVPLDPVRQRALIDLRFNLGPTRFRGFKLMLAACERGDWFEAAAEMEDSQWSQQVQPARVAKLTRMLRTGRD